MDICFEGVGQVAATFKVNGGAVQPGMAVTLTGNGTVGLGSGAPCGVLLGGVRGGAAAVQIGGVAKVAYSGTAPAVGWKELVCDGLGGVKAVAKAAAKTVAGNGDETGTGTDTGAAAEGLKCLVLAVDQEEKTVVVKL